MPIFDTTHRIFVAFAVVGLISTCASTAVLIYKTKKSKEWGGEETPPDILAVQENLVARPLVPTLFTAPGLSFGVLALGLSGLFLTIGLNAYPRLFVSLCLAFSCEIAVSMAVYVYRLRNDKRIIFVPKAIGQVGKVLKDIPAGMKGVGSIRLFFNGQVVTVASKSVDEVILTKGTDVKILYADSDRVAVVERYIARSD